MGIEKQRRPSAALACEEEAVATGCLSRDFARQAKGRRKNARIKMGRDGSSKALKQVHRRQFLLSELLVCGQCVGGAASPAQLLRPTLQHRPDPEVPVVRERDGTRECAVLWWGLIPCWGKDAKTAYKAINARAKTEAMAPTYRVAFKARRCLVSDERLLRVAEKNRRHAAPTDRLQGPPPIFLCGSMGALGGPGEWQNGRKPYYHHPPAE